MERANEPMNDWRDDATRKRPPLAPCTAPRTVTLNGKRKTEWRGRPCYGGYMGERHF